jgi:hypothetical protein
LHNAATNRKYLFYFWLSGEAPKTFPAEIFSIFGQNIPLESQSGKSTSILEFTIFVRFGAIDLAVGYLLFEDGVKLKIV